MNYGVDKTNTAGKFLSQVLSLLLDVPVGQGCAEGRAEIQFHLLRLNPAAVVEPCCCG